ncbi:MAG TPA: hypothetical protein VJH55_01300 [Candidatus Paceibacterota bacterium]
MGARGPKPEGKVAINWTPDFAYAIGLLVTDGNLSPDGRHIAFVSKEVEQLENFKRALKIDNKLTPIRSNYNDSLAYKVQFGDVLFYRFLNSIGITARKSLTIGEIAIPRHLFGHYFRGVLDGDGCFYSYWDKRWKSSYMFYVSVGSGSYKHCVWLKKEISSLFGIKGHIATSKRKASKNPYHQLRYAKRESLILLRKVYAGGGSMYLTRKKLKIDKALGIIGVSL